MEDKAKALVALLKAQNRTITTAESLTGGRIAAAITEVPGSSQVFPGGVVSYCDQVKHRILGVPAEALERYGAVSEPVAKAMADGAAKLMGTNLALSATGLAGPDGDGTHPVGTVFLGLWADGTLICQKRVFSGDRAAVQEQSVKTALDMALDYLKT